MIPQSLTEEFLDQLDCMSTRRLQEIYFRSGIEIMERDAEWLAQAEMAECEASFDENGELDAITA
jgi:hypothetical protein